MRGDITGAIHNFIVDMAKRKRIVMALAALSLFVAGGVFWQLRLMGVTMEGPDRCDPAADVESSAAWEAALPERTGDPAADLVAVADSQLGYRESVRNFVLSQDGETTRGYTRYGAWYGNPYGDWNAMFACFCLHYAGISGIPLNSGCRAWSVQLEERGLLRQPGACAPSPGDLVFFDRAGDGRPDHVAIVRETGEDRLTVILGDSGHAVALEELTPDELWVVPLKEIFPERPGPGSNGWMAAPGAAGTVTVSTLEELQNALAAADGQIIELSGTVSIDSKTELDLNGNTVRSAEGQPAFAVQEGGSLFIRDSAAVTEVTTAAETSADEAGRPAGLDGGILTWYVTETEIEDGLVGTTKETLVKHTTALTGKIVGSVAVQPGGAFTLESGALCGCSGYAVQSDGGAVTVVNGYICGNGGGIKADGSDVGISAGVIAGNMADSGAGIRLEGSVLNMTGGVISGNNAAVAGGGIYCETGTINMAGGMITNNCVPDALYDINIGGGGVYMKGPGDSVLNLTGGCITANKASTGGGISTYNADNLYSHNVRICMTGGFVTGNLATLHEGGGMAFRAQSHGEINAGYITNNKTQTSSDWGGGGIFCSEQAEVRLMNALITQNGAGGFGGGVAGCSTGTILVQVDGGAAVYDNTALGTNVCDHSDKKADWDALKDPVFMSSGFKDYFCAKTSAVYGTMLGGGNAGWTGSADSVPVGPEDFDPYVTAVERMGLDAHPDPDARAAAVEEAAVYINGNYAHNHGGGLLCNGLMVFGTGDKPVEFEKGSELTLLGKKHLVDTGRKELPLGDRVFTFVVEDQAEGGTVLSTGTSDSSGRILFDKPLLFHTKGTHSVYIRELPSGDPAVISDSSRYRLEVSLENKDASNQENGLYQLVTWKISKAVLYKINKDGTEEEIARKEYQDWESRFEFADLDFVNMLADRTGITVVKKWEGFASGHPDSVTVRLLQNGSVYQPGGEQVLNDENNWTFTWPDLPVDDGAGKCYNYQIEEVNADGFRVEYSYVSSTESGSFGYAPVEGMPAAGRECYLTAGGGALFLTHQWGELKLTEKLSADMQPLFTFEAAENGGVYIKNAASGKYLCCTGESWQPFSFTTEKSAKALFYLENGFLKAPEVSGGGQLTGKYMYLSWFSQDGNRKLCLSETSENAFRVCTYGLIGGSGNNDVTVTVTNAPKDEVSAYELPEAGGGGTVAFSLGGTAILAAGIWIYLNQRKRERGARF